MSPFSEAELARFLELLPNPALLVRGPRLLAVNEPYLAALGFRREELVGRDYRELIPPEELAPMGEYQRRMLTERSDAATVVRVNAVDVRGGRRRWLAHVRRVDGGEPEPLLLVSCSEVPGVARDLTLAEQVVQLSAALSAARTEAEVRAAVVNGFRDAGIHATLSLVDERGEVTLFEAPASADQVPSAEVFREALESRRPVFVLPPDTQSFIVYVPVLRSDRPPELLVLWDSPFETMHLSLLSLFARQLAVTLESTRRQAQLGRRNDELSLLLDLARTTAGTLELETILDVACDFLVKLLDVSNCFIMLLDAERSNLRAAASSSAHREFFRTVVIPLDADSIAARATRSGRVQVLEDLSKAHSHLRELSERFGEKALLALPLTARNEVIGCIVLDDTRAPRAFPPEVVALAEATAGQLALSVHNAQLYASLKQSYAELAQTRAEMVKQERLAALGELSAIVAHEVRNPLGVIFNAVSSLRRVTREDHEAGMLLEIVGEECDRLNRIVSDLLDFSRPTGLSLEQEDLAELLQECVDAALAGHGGAGLWVVEREIEPGLPRVVGDRQLLRQAFINVIINALQAMPRGGRVHLRAAREGGERVLVEVRDEGQGIPPEVQARVFEPFFTTKAKGTGLGLAVVRRIVEDHRGEVSLASAPGQGATFRFHLPLNRGPSRRAGAVDTP